MGMKVTDRASGGVLLLDDASPNVQVPVPQSSPLVAPFPFAYKTARLKSTFPVPAAGAVQSADHERRESLL